jgi:hypothetical protein
MFNSKRKRVVFATGILFVLSLSIFGSIIAVAWMNMNNSMAVSADSYTGDFAAEDEVALASRLGNDIPMLDSRLGNDVPMIDSRLGNDVPMIDSRLGSDTPVLHSRIGYDVPILHSRIGYDVPILHSRIGYDVPVLHSRIGYDVPVLHARIDPGIVTSVDYRDYVFRVDYREYVRSSRFKESVGLAGLLGFKGSVSLAESTDNGRISDFSSVWQMIRTTH